MTTKYYTYSHEVFILQEQLSQNFPNVFQMYFCQNMKTYKGLICFPGQVGPSERR